MSRKKLSSKHALLFLKDISFLDSPGVELNIQESVQGILYK